jgi:uncharacterized protein YdeI (YjbR/CyaY-like superfamily)
VKPTFFRDVAQFRRWLEKHHASAPELWVGYYKKASGRGGMVYKEALEQALCFGWIDGQVRSIDEDTYIQRFTPRRKGSYWSAVNIRKAQELIERGLMTPAGRAAFNARPQAPPGRYSNENRDVVFDAAMLKTFRANRQAWSWFEQQAPSFRRVCAHWVTSAKKPETRDKRLALLIACSARGERPPGLIPRPGVTTARASRSPRSASPTAAPSGTARPARAAAAPRARRAGPRSTRNDR